MITQRTTVREFISKEIDVDIYDDYDERIGIAFCGPLKLTEEGEKKFGPILNLPVELYINTPDETPIEALLCVSDNEANLSLAADLFLGAAGYCSEHDYNLWFDDKDDIN